MPRSSLRVVRPPNPIDELTEKAAAAWAHAAPLPVLACRTFGHLWLDGTRSIAPLSRTFYGRELHCGRCGTVRIDIYRRGEYGVWKRRYTYPDGYQRQPATDEPSSATPRYVVQAELEERSDKLDPSPELLAFYRKAVTK